MPQDENTVFGNNLLQISGLQNSRHSEKSQPQYTFFYNSFLKVENEILWKYEEQSKPETVVLHRTNARILGDMPISSDGDSYSYFAALIYREQQVVAF